MTHPDHDPQQGVTDARDGAHKANLEVLDGVEGIRLALLLDGQAGAQQEASDGRRGIEVLAGVCQRLAVGLVVIAVDLLQGVRLGKDDGRGKLGLVVEAVHGHAPATSALVEVLLGQDLALGLLGRDGGVTHLQEPPHWWSWQQRRWSASCRPRRRQLRPEWRWAEWQGPGRRRARSPRQGS